MAVKRNEFNRYTKDMKSDNNLLIIKERKNVNKLDSYEKKGDCQQECRLNENKESPKFMKDEEAKETITIVDK
uniref:Uncharacterized protein n=2 Tax=Brugia TaxID=6278 RepID=A8Q626_BRUMA